MGFWKFSSSFCVSFPTHIPYLLEHLPYLSILNNRTPSAERVLFCYANHPIIHSVYEVRVGAKLTSDSTSLWTPLQSDNRYFCPLSSGLAPYKLSPCWVHIKMTSHHWETTEKLTFLISKNEKQIKKATFRSILNEKLPFLCLLSL